MNLVDSEKYTFDEAAADRPVRFIETFCRHFAGRHAGTLFRLHPE